MVNQIINKFFGLYSFKAEHPESYRDEFLFILIVLFTSIIASIIYITIHLNRDPGALKIQILTTIVLLFIGLFHLKLRQNTLTILIFSLVCLTHLSTKYLHYNTLLSPSVLWFAIITGLVTWQTKIKISSLFLFLTNVLVYGLAYYLLRTNDSSPSQTEILFYLSFTATSLFFSLLIHMTRRTYHKYLNLYKEELHSSIHKGQLETIGELAGNIAHEINNPLQVIKGNAFKLSKKLKKNFPEEENLIRYSTNIDRTVDRTSNLISGLLRLSRTGEDIEVSLAPFKETWKLVYGLMEQRLANSNVALSIKNMEYDVNSNIEYLSQVIINIMRNSIDEIDNTENPWIIVDVREDHIDIIDSGNGIKEEIEGKILTPFFSTKKAGKGTGLGLSLCHNLMVKMGGNLTYEKERENTTFRLHLPNQ